MATGIDLGKYKLGWHDNTSEYVNTPKKGVNEQVVRDISHGKSEPEWMTKFRLNALKRFERKPMLDWFAKNMPDLDFDDIYYYLKPTTGQVNDWDMLPEEMKTTYERLGIPEAERKFSPASPRSTRAKSCTTRTAKTSPAWVCSSATWTRPCASTPRSSASTWGP
jgi:Fe-S cluster assembly protein SufB